MKNILPNQNLIKHLEHFLLELGTGFTFIARQKRITLEGTHFRPDLLLYHRILKCLIAIDLKIREFTYADAGQMNLYLNYLKILAPLKDLMYTAQTEFILSDTKSM